MIFLKRIQKDKILYVLLGISILFFLIKGFNYSVIGSYIPIIFIIIIVIILCWSFNFNLKTHRRLLRFWAILIIIWALARISIWLILQIDLNLTESHLREQFGFFQHLISLLIMIIGFGMLRRIKKLKTQDVC